MTASTGTGRAAAGRRGGTSRRRRACGGVVATAVATGLATGLLAACGEAAPQSQDPVTLTMWTHGGTEAEQAVLRSQVASWDERHDDAGVDLKVVPEGEYTDRLQAAAAAGEVPDVVDVDGPLVSSFAYQGVLAPLDDLLPADVVSDALPSLIAQGTWNHRLYALGAFESGLALFADRARLAAAGIRIPVSPDDAWSAEEASAALVALAVDDPDGLVLDTKRSYGVGEWSTYGFSPLVVSAGGGLLDEGTGRAHGAIDGPEAVQALTTLQRWHAFVDPDESGTAFVERRVALSWVGHWEFGRYAEALGDDLALVPLPDLGHGTRATTGSWAWAVGARSAHPQEAADLLAHLLSTDSVLETTAANGAVPGSTTALEQAPDYRPGGSRHLYAQQLVADCTGGPDAGCVAVQRPATPGYPVITAAFAQALDEVLRGGDPAVALEAAAAAIDADRDANDGYAAPAP